MPKLVCGLCQVEFVIKTSGVYVVEFASFGPYKIWNADEWACPECGYPVTAGFSAQLLAEHYEPRFAEVLRQAKESGKVRCDYENAAQRRAWMDGLIANGGDHANIGSH